MKQITHKWTTTRWSYSEIAILILIISIVTTKSLASAPSIVNNNENIVDHHFEKLENFKDLELILREYLHDALRKNTSIEIVPGVDIIPQNSSDYVRTSKSLKTARGRGFSDFMINEFEHFADGHVMSINVPRAVESGRLFFFKGLKKLMWPVVIGIQIAKTILFALFLPSILGSFGKILGKGVGGFSSLSNHPEPVEDLEFKDNGVYGTDQDEFNTNTEYNYGDDSTNIMANQMYDSATANNAMSRFGPGDKKVTYVNSYSHGTNTLMTPKRDDYKIFHDIPASSLLLTNYDPFYSPLLSRLDAVFNQLGFQADEEKCREKLVCMMYANPAKYAPYSNLISAQLSRELNQLKKPVSDNPDILRFFKYMKAAKDGQDGVNCEDTFEGCVKLKESSAPVMINNYNDINKLVQARKL